MNRFASMVAGAVLMLLACVNVCRAEWVEITTKKGEQFAGSVLEETQFKIRIKTRIAGIDTEMTFAASEIKKIDRKPETSASAPGATPGAPAQTPGSLTPAPAPKSAGGYAVVPLTGSFGEEVTAQFIKEAVDRTRREHAEAVIFEVNSPGGLVTELSAIREYLDTVSDIKVGFYVKDSAMSAAALLCMSSRNFYMGKGGRFGAAVGWYVNDTGKIDVNAKFNAAFASEWRGRAEKAGRPGLLVDAMVLLEKEVWADTSTTPWTLTATPPAKTKNPDGEGEPAIDKKWKQIDGDTTILSMTADEAVAIGAIDGELDSASAIPAKLGITAPETVAFDGQKLSAQHLTEYKNDIAQAKQALIVANTKFTELKTSKDKADARQKLGAMLGQLQRLSDMYNRKTHVKNFCLRNGLSMERIDSLLKEIPVVMHDLK